jgi:hypothetical protein
VVSHISRKTSEMWGTRHGGGDRATTPTSRLNAKRGWPRSPFLDLGVPTGTIIEERPARWFVCHSSARFSATFIFLGGAAPAVALLEDQAYDEEAEGEKGRQGGLYGIVMQG